MKRKQKQILVGLLAVAMVAANFAWQPANEARALDQPTDVSNLLSDSAMNSTATSIITFTTASSTLNGDYWQVDFPAGFNIATAGVECGYGDANFAAATSGQSVICTWSGTTIAAGTSSRIVVSDHVNPPSANTYHFYYYHNASDDREKEFADFMVSIHPDVYMHARVQATLTFTVSGIATGTPTYSGVTCDDTTWANRLDFYSLNPGASTTLCHRFDVSTNASDGYILTVEQDGNLRNAASDEINSFVMSPTGTGSSTQAYTWTPPVAQLDVDYTYGHMGLHSDDINLESLTGALDFGTVSTALYAGLNGVEPMVVMHHNGPTSSGSAAWQNYGRAMIAYTAEVTALQQAGDYENQLTYICTPTY